ncbi:MAG: ATP-binding protein [Selenomonadaceae bacterium]|nr:ATP-binding protein [Selenomonadaceae bacterium]
MSEDFYRPRLIDAAVDKYIKTFGAVCIEGPKWCGKTWTSRHHSNSEILIGSPEGNFQNRRLAEMSPATVLSGNVPRLIDEWQDVPPLWDAVRYEVDQRGKSGQFILTGSSTPKYKGIRHSGAGRIARLRMQPMSLFETGDSSGVVSLQDLCNGRLETQMTGEVELHNLTEYIIRGGWPANQNTDIEAARLLPEEYVKAIVEDDVHRIDDTPRNRKKVMLLLRSLARNESTIVSNRTLKRDIKEIDADDIEEKTIASYLDVFDRLFLTANQKPFAANIRSSVRIKQLEKRHFVDPSLACVLLQMNTERMIGDLNTFGFLFESLVARDLSIYAQTFGAKLFHYQDYRNREIDAVIELENGDWCAFEVKLGANQIDAAAAGLLKIRNQIAAEEGGKPPKVLCVICGLSNAAYQREDGVFVVPISALRN